MSRLLILILVVDVIYCCQDLWSNSCRVNEDCCSQNCDKPPNWAFGVCKPGTANNQVNQAQTQSSSGTSNNGPCQGLYTNQCKVNDDCCSKNCDKPANWAYGVCKPGNTVTDQVNTATNQVSSSQTTSNGQCRGLYSNQCRVNDDCCSKNCDKPSNWAYGVCRPRASGAVTNQVNTGTNQVSPAHSVGNALVTFDEFTRAVTSNGFPAPNQAQYESLVKMAGPAGGITSKQELAMFLAQILHESGGLIYKKEIRCKDNGCPGDYRNGGEAPNKFYYGRGYIQLTWIYNYDQCSQALYGDRRLVDNPDLVSDTEDGAWGSAFWFWRKNVHDSPGVQQFHFGATTKAINGGLECSGSNQDIARKRFNNYVNILKAFNLNVQPIEQGCYN